MSTDDRIRQALEQALPDRPVDVDRLTAELSERLGALQPPDGPIEFESELSVQDDFEYEKGEVEASLESGETGPTEDVELGFDDADSSYQPQGEGGKTLDGSAATSYPLEKEDGTTGGGTTGTGGGLGLPVLGLIGIVAGGLAGILIALSIGSPSPVSSATLDIDGVPVFACPGEQQVGTLYRGDRVLIIGQSDGWYAVRNVRGSGETVFIDARYVTADEPPPPDDPNREPRALSDRSCDDEGILTIGDVEESTTTTQPGDTTTTVPGATTTTTQPGATTTAPPAATTTTTAPDTTPPVISNASVNPTEVWEQDGGGISCPPGTPRQATVSAFVTDNRDVASVVASWQVPGQGSTSAVMSGGPTYTTTFGPIPAETVSPFAPYDHDITITITAHDAAGNQSTTSVMITLWSIGDCFG